MNMNDITNRAEELAAYAKQYLELDERDEIYIKNRLLEILQKCDGSEPDEQETDEIFAVLSLLPSALNRRFDNILHSCGSKAATDWFYSYCVHNRYVKKDVLDKNPRFESNGLIITINKAKPEFRDPQKARVGNSVEGGFCKCVICRENEGFGARNKRNLRTVDIWLGGEKWFWQYSPYGYFNEHGIAVNCSHIPMHIDGSTFTKLMDFADMFPHYFIGCNAPLPRIGGSVLSHDHYQGGGEILPVHTAKAAYILRHDDYPDALAEVVDWPGTVIRVVSENRRSIGDICGAINKKWVKYSDIKSGIIAEDNEGVHNAVSPTVRKTERGYEMNVILRSNITSSMFPDGVFHAHPEYHVIKKESIGLIEAQGLFILPGRLSGELAAVEKMIDENAPLLPGYTAFRLIYDETKAICLREGVGAREAMKAELGSICFRILENTAVFKDKRQTVKFLNDLGFRLCSDTNIK